MSELTQQTTNYVLPAAHDCMGSTAHAHPQRCFENVATNQTTRRCSYIGNIAYITYAVLYGPLRCPYRQLFFPCIANVAYMA